MAHLEIRKIKDGWQNSLVIYQPDVREHDLDIGVEDPINEEHISWIGLTKEEVVELRDFLNKHLQERTT